MTDRNTRIARGPTRILVIDDDDEVRQTLCNILRSAGFETTAARNGEEGLRLFDAVGADAVVTDLIMPGMEGIETIRELRRRRAGVKIVAISGGGRSGVADYLALAGKLGADATLSKPFSRDELLAALSDLRAGES